MGQSRATCSSVHSAAGSGGRKRAWRIGGLSSAVVVTMECRPYGNKSSGMATRTPF